MKSKIDTIRKEFEVALGLIIKEAAVIDSLKIPIQHSVFPAGKRIRPILALGMCDDLGGDYRRLLPAAIALELVHNASLIHDDLPALDNDAVRRGRPTCHTVFGEASALLAGDLMVALAFQVLAGIELKPAVAREMVQELGDSFVQLCNGQHLDLRPQKNLNDIISVNRLKTGALFSCACKFSAIGAGMKPAVVDMCAELGESLGLSFQIIDDYLDMFGTAEEKGRPDSSDQRNLRVTFATTHTKREIGSALHVEKERLISYLDRICKRLDIQRTGLANTVRLISQIFARAKGFSFAK